MSIDKYLYEIIDDYKSASLTEEKNEIFNSFCSSVWGSKNKRRTYTKTIKFKVRSDLLESEIGQIFDTWSVVEYTGYKAMTNDTDWCSLIRQKINNLYTRYFDKSVILKRDYMNLLKTPYNLYYRWIKGSEMNPNELIDVIEDSIYKAAELKIVYQKQKMDLSWNDYKNLIEGFLLKTFNNCKLIGDYENEKLTNKYIYEFASEDNFYISYICDYLENEMKQYQKKYYGLKSYSTTKQDVKHKRCKECGDLIKDKSKTRPVLYCEKCKEEHRKDTYKKYNKKRKSG